MFHVIFASALRLPPVVLMEYQWSRNQVNMARFNYSGVAITGGTGRLNSSLGGTVLMKNGVVRNYVTPVNPQTASQQEVRTAFAFLTAAWKGLTLSQQNAWIAAWQSGDWQVSDPFTGTSRAYGSAKDLFIALNLNFLIAGDALNAPATEFIVPPATTSLPALGTTSFVFDASAGTAVLTYTGSVGDSVLVIRATPPVSPGNMRLTSVRSKLRNVMVSTAVSPIAAGAAYTGLFGAITSATGLKVFWVVEQISTLNGKRALVGSGSSVIVA